MPLTNPLDLRIGRRITDTLRQQQVCLANEIKMRLELDGIYQDASGRVVDLLVADGTIRSDTYELSSDQPDPSKLYFLPTVSQSDVEKISHVKIGAHKQYISYMMNNSHVGDFLEALTYIGMISIKKQTPQLNLTILRPHDAIDRIDELSVPLDCFLLMGLGKYGVQAKNTLQMFTPLSTVLKKFLEAANKGAFRPILVSRMASKELKRTILTYRGRTLDTGVAMICTKENVQFATEPLELLGIRGMVAEVPHLIEIRGDAFNGTQFFENRRYEQYSFDEIAASSVTNVPEPLMRKLRGTIALLYSTTFLDHAGLQLEHRGEALIGAFLLTQSFSYLLRAKGRSVGASELVGYARPNIKGALAFQVIQKTQEELVNLLLPRLRQLRDIGFLSEPSRREFVASPSLAYPEELLRIS